MKRRGWLIALCVMALMVGAFYGAATLQRAPGGAGAARAAGRRHHPRAGDLLRGGGPLSLLACLLCKENYGVDVDEEHYAVFFSSFADNVLPSVRVVQRGEGAGA